MTKVKINKNLSPHVSKNQARRYTKETNNKSEDHRRTPKNIESTSVDSINSPSKGIIAGDSIINT